MSQSLPLGPDNPGSRAPGAALDEIGLKRPEVPADVSFDPSELPDDAARAALSRLMAEPDPIPIDNAPVGRIVAASPDARPVTVRGLPPTADPAVPAPVGPREPDLASPPASVAAGPDTKPAGDGSVLGPAGAALAGAAAFDPASLQKALDAYVGAEPVAIGGRVSPQEEARYRERATLRAVYAARGFAPLWVEDGAFNARGRSIAVRLDHAAEDGLDLRAFSVVPPKPAEPSTLAASELSLTEAAVAYGKQATGGRVDPARIAALIAAKPDVADAARVIGALLDAPDAGDALRSLNPPHRGYALLRDKLAELRRASDGAKAVAIPYGPLLKPGMRDIRVPLIRARFGLDVSDAGGGENDLVYDPQAVAAIAGFQKDHRLPASGILTIRTVAALAGGGDPKRFEDEIVANMERWRWLPRDMGQDRIEVNIPDFTAVVMHGDEVFHQARVVVGQPDKATPVFSETMRFIIVNPYWNVPLSIVKKEMMPKLAADPNYFANHGYETVERDGQTYVRQPPGDSNALGRIKFMFPNPYSVYLHDTNARSLFGNERRALSHGCVRVDAPFKFAEAVLGKQNGWTEARMKRLVGGDERVINLPQPLPIHIVYFTAFVDEAGVLQTRDDVYGYSAKLRAALGLSAAARAGQVAVN